jgi:hypothetical protein
VPIVQRVGSRSIRGESLSQVIMPEDFYRVGSSGTRCIDTVGLRACRADWPSWPEIPGRDLVQRSQFNLSYDIGLQLFGGVPQAAMRFAAKLVSKLAAPIQLELAAAKSSGRSTSCNAVPS